MQLKKNATKQKWLKNFKFCYFIGLAVHEVLCECFLCEEAGGQELDYPRHVPSSVPQWRSGASSRSFYTAVLCDLILSVDCGAEGGCWIIKPQVNHAWTAVLPRRGRHSAAVSVFRPARSLDRTTLTLTRPKHRLSVICVEQTSAFLPLIFLHLKILCDQ